MCIYETIVTITFLKIVKIAMPHHLRRPPAVADNAASPSRLIGTYLMIWPLHHYPANVGDRTANAICVARKQHNFRQMRFLWVKHLAI